MGANPYRPSQLGNFSLDLLALGAFPVKTPRAFVLLVVEQYDGRANVLVAFYSRRHRRMASLVYLFLLTRAHFAGLACSGG